MENVELISKAVAYVKSNANKSDITISDISVHAGFSTDYFNRIFLSHTGFTVMAYVNYIRTKKAAQLLRTTDKSILEIALAVGYNSHEGFIKAFKKYYGMPPHDYRMKKNDQVLYWGELVDQSVAARFVHENPDFRLVDPDIVISHLLEKDAKRYGYLCTTIKYMGLAIAAPEGQFENGFIGIGDKRNGSIYLEMCSDDFELLSAWFKRFPNEKVFYSACEPLFVKEKLAVYDIKEDISAVPQSFYFGERLNCTLPENMLIRPLSYEDKSDIVKWAGGRQDGYISHLLREKDYLDASVLEYGVFQDGELIAVAGCGIDEVQGFKLNNCCAIRFSNKKLADNGLYRLIFSFVVNDILDKGILPFDDLQHGEYARLHGNFSASDMGFQVVNWRYTILN